MRYFVEIAGEELELDVEAKPDGSFQVTRHGAGASGESHAVRILHTAHGCRTLELDDGRTLELRAGGDGEPPRVLGAPARVESARERATRSATRATSDASSELRAPMPGRIVRVLCAPGAPLKKGEPLLIMEAMKMENELLARADATVSEVCVAAGDTVERNALLVRFV